MNVKIQENNRLMKQAGCASLTVAFILIILKCVTFFITGSVAILSSLFDSIQDIMTSAVNMVAIRHAIEPADKEHRFGHGKAQALGGLVQSFIIALASVFLLFESVKRFFNPKVLDKVSLGLVITVIAIVLTIILVRFQTYVIKKTNSLSIRVDRAHYTGDILMNAGVIVSIVMSYYFDWQRLDALFGMGVSVYLFVVVYQVIHDSFKMLMDTEVSEEFRQQIKKMAHSFPEVKAMQDLRTRQSGSHTFIQFCIRLEENMTLRQAHDITDMIEDRIKEQFPDAEVMIHPEPERKRL